MYIFSYLSKALLLLSTPTHHPRLIILLVTHSLVVHVQESKFLSVTAYIHKHNIIVISNPLGKK